MASVNDVFSSAFGDSFKANTDALANEKQARLKALLEPETERAKTQAQLDPKIKALQAMIQGGQVPQGAGVNIEGVGYTRPIDTARKDALVQKQENAYAKGLEKYSDAGGALSELERVTNRDGKGGVLTNPNAKLLSGGKVANASPDWVAGVMDMVTPGAAEERKAIARYKLAAGHALVGARANPAMQKQISDSLGGIVSGDPDLMAKGIRGSANILGNQVKTVQSGYNPATQETVHGRLGGNPHDIFSKVAQDPPAGVKQAPPIAKTPPQRSKPLDQMSDKELDDYEKQLSGK